MITSRYRLGHELISGDAAPVWFPIGWAQAVYPDAPDRQMNGAAMAQKVQTLFIDDLDGSEADGTVRFGLDGTEYEIDLNTEHTQHLRDALAPYVSAARRARGSTGSSTRNARKTPAAGPNTTEVREWAKVQGIDVKDRGRIPAELVVKFKAATGK